MSEKEKKYKKPIREDAIYRIMLIITFSVAGIFFLKNIINFNLGAMIAIGSCLLILGIALLVMKLAKVHKRKKQFVVSIMIMFIIFVISLFSGEYYSDDFPLYLAVIGLSGTYLEPTVTVVQIVLTDVLLALQYILIPEKADPLSQFIMCMALTTLAAYMFYLTIKRGRGFIQVGNDRAKEAESLVASITRAGTKLQENCETSSQRVDGLREASEKLEERTKELRVGSDSIIDSAQDIAHTFEEVHQSVQATGKQIDNLNTEVRKVESALSENKTYMHKMNKEMASVKKAVDEANSVFEALQRQILEISAVTDQLNNIATSTNMLALNASIEAARAGQSGAGFAVVASKVQELAVDSNRCSNEVVDVVTAMQSQIQVTTKQLADSTEAIDTSMTALNDLQASFDSLNNHFVSLYDNIGQQNATVSEMESVFGTLEDKIDEMSSCTEENQGYVDEISNAVGLYRSNMRDVMDDTRQVNELSVALLTISKERQISE